MSKPDLKVVSGETPAPPYPDNVKANGWKPEIDIQRLKQSRTWVLCPITYRPWLLMLWIESWESIPAGTYPADDDEMIAARIGLDFDDFTARRRSLMRGWIPHSDGLLYHPYITDQILKMLDGRKGNAARQAKYKAKKVTHYDGEVTRYSPASNAQEQEQEQEQETEGRAESRGSSTRERSDNGCCFSVASLPDEWRKKAQEIRPDLNPDAVFREFADHWTTGDGAGAKRVHWSAVWTKWVGREKGTPANTVNGNNGGWKNGRESDHDRIKRTNDELIARARAAASLG